MQPRSPLPVRGYHGTSRAAADDILREGFRPSANSYDWLGTGIYFWQDAPRRAREWAEANHSASPAVLEATIDLIDCLDLLDVGWQGAMQRAHTEFVAQRVRTGEPLPRQTSGAHRLDTAMLNLFVGVLEQEGATIRSVRAPFAEGGPVFPRSALSLRGHVQIAVRDRSVILDVHAVDWSAIPHDH
ncbi:MAG: hypothetical protein WED87_06325 [Dehalococcoidia bacterium]